MLAVHELVPLASKELESARVRVPAGVDGPEETMTAGVMVSEAANPVATMRSLDLLRIAIFKTSFGRPAPAPARALQLAFPLTAASNIALGRLGR